MPKPALPVELIVKLFNDLVDAEVCVNNKFPTVPPIIRLLVAEPVTEPEPAVNRPFKLSVFALITKLPLVKVSALFTVTLEAIVAKPVNLFTIKFLKAPVLLIL